MLWLRPSGEHLGVVAGTTRHAVRRVPQPVRCGLHPFDHRRVEVDGLEPGQRAQLDRDALGLARLVDEGAEALFGRLQGRLVGVAQVDGHRDRLSDHVDEVGERFETPDGRHLVPAHVGRDGADPGRDLRRDHQRIPAQAHRRGPGVCRAAGERQFGPRDPLHPFDDADRDAGVLQDRALFDVQFDERVRERGAGCRS